MLEIIREGYVLELARKPPSSGMIPTNPPPRFKAAMAEEVEGLVRKKAVVVVPPDLVRSGTYSTYFLVPKKDGGIRPILNLKKFNLNMKPKRFKMETLQSVLAALRPGLWLASLDLKDAYLHVPIRPVHQRFLRFLWQGTAYEFRCLPFGLSTAPRVFTKILLPLIAHLRSLGVVVYVYLDDLLITGGSPAVVRRSVETTSDVLTRAGFILNLTKSEPTPSQDLTYIGGRLRMDVGKVFLPPPRTEALLKCVRTFLRVGQYKPAHQFLRLLGLMASCLAVVPYARLYMRPIQWHVKDRWNPTKGLNAPIMVNMALTEHLQWWLSPTNLQQGVLLSPPAHTLTVTTDASLQGWGGFLQRPGTSPDLVQGKWTPQEQLSHINLLELRAVRLTFELFESHLTNKSVLLESDNTSTVAYLNKQGGGSLSLARSGGQGILPLAHSQTHIHPCHTQARRGQCPGQLSESTLSRSAGMGAESHSPAQTVSDLGHTPDRPVCLLSKPSSPNVLLIGVGRGGGTPRRNEPDVDGLGMLRFSPLPPSHQGPQQDTDREGERHSHSPQVAETLMVQRSTPPVRGGTPPPSPQPQPLIAEAAGDRDPIPRVPPDPTLDGLEAERRSLQDQGFPEPVIHVMLAAKRTSTRKVYDSRWSAFADWCSQRDLDPTVVPVTGVLEFLTSIIPDKSTNTLRGYVSAISSRHAPVDDASLGSHPAVSQWLKGLVQSKGISRSIVPAWDLDIVLAALKSHPFEPAANDKFATWKTVFLVAVASARRAGELHALRMDQPYIRWSATDVTLFPDVTFLPKVNTPFHASQPICLPAMHDEKDSDLRLLCVRRALKRYVNSSASYRKARAQQLFVCYGGKSRGNPVSKYRISSWLVELIAWVYTHQNLPVPQGIKGHQTRKQSTSIADLAGVDPQLICAAATWASRCTFAKHYRLNLAAKARSHFGRTVLQVAGSSTARRQSGYRIPRTDSHS